MELDTGGPAFPNSITEDPSAPGERLFPYEHGLGGMTLLDWFAGQALAGNLNDGAQLERIAKEGYDIAAAMVAEKRKREKG